MTVPHECACPLCDQTVREDSIRHGGTHISPLHGDRGVLTLDSISVEDYFEVYTGARGRALRVSLPQHACLCGSDYVCRHWEIGNYEFTPLPQVPLDRMGVL